MNEPLHIITIKTEMAKYYKVGMRVVIDERYPLETATVKEIDYVGNRITIVPMIARYWSKEEINNFPLRVFYDTKQYLK